MNFQPPEEDDPRDDDQKLQSSQELKIVAWFKHGPYDEGEPLTCVFENPNDDICYSALTSIESAVAALDDQRAHLTRAAQIVNQYAGNKINNLKTALEQSQKALQELVDWVETGDHQNGFLDNAKGALAQIEKQLKS